MTRPGVCQRCRRDIPVVGNASGPLVYVDVALAVTVAITQSSTDIGLVELTAATLVATVVAAVAW